jgi:glutaredoxin
MAPSVTLYTRAGCHLCDEMKQVISEAGRRLHFEYREVDIDGDAALHARYNTEVPVIAIDGKDRFRHRVKLEDLLERLSPGTE